MTASRRAENDAMRINEIMKTEVATCSPHEDLSVAAHLMRERDCGFIPVVDVNGTIAGVITDRDVCLFAGDRGRSMSHMAVADAMSRPVVSCFVEDNVRGVLATMATHQVRRVTVVDKHGHLHGIVSIDDIVQAPRIEGGPSAEEIVATLKAISARRRVAAARV